MTYSPRKMAKHLATYISDKQAIASHISRELGQRCTVKDIDRMLEHKATDGIPRSEHIPKLLGAITWTPTLSTKRRGVDPLAIACLKYGIKHGGVMGADVASCKVMLEALAA